MQRASRWDIRTLLCIIKLLMSSKSRQMCGFLTGTARRSWRNSSTRWLFLSGFRETFTTWVRNIWKATPISSRVPGQLPGLMGAGAQDVWKAPYWGRLLPRMDSASEALVSWKDSYFEVRGKSACQNYKRQNVLIVWENQRAHIKRILQSSREDILNTAPKKARGTRSLTGPKLQLPHQIVWWHDWSGKL